MSIENPINKTAVNEAQVRELAEGFISQTCQRHQVKRNQLTDEAIADAYKTARARVQHEKELSEDKNYQALQLERERSRQLELQVEALKMSRPVANESGNAGHARSSRLPDSELVRSKLGPAAWNSLTIDARLMACGVQPSEVTAAAKEEIAEVFGRNANSKRAADLHVSNPSKYRKLKTIASVLDLAGK